MKHKTSHNTPTGINIDFYHFYPFIVAYLSDVQYYVKRDIPDSHIGDLTAMVFDWLLNLVNNFTVIPCPRSWRLYCYFDKEDTREIFDGLFLDFLDFLREKGIEAEKHYVVKRGRQWRYCCIETHKVTPNYQ